MTVATKFYTWTEMWAMAADLCDMEDEAFVDSDEAMIRGNMAIDEAETLILKMNKGYFRTKDPITLVSGTDEYAMPAKIYAHKFERIIYRNGSTTYEVKSLKHVAALDEYHRAIAAGETSLSRPLRYFIYNETPGSPKIMFTPPVGESGAYITCWFYRQANRITTGSDVIDIPEFASFVLAYLVEWIYWKIAAGSPRHQAAMAETERQRGAMVTTLQDMIADGNDLIEADFSHYEEHN